MKPELIQKLLNTVIRGTYLHGSSLLTNNVDYYRTRDLVENFNVSAIPEYCGGVLFHAIPAGLEAADLEKYIVEMYSLGYSQISVVLTELQIAYSGGTFAAAGFTVRCKTKNRRTKAVIYHMMLDFYDHLGEL